MGRDERQLRRMRGEALSRLLQGLTYGGCLVIFYALMAIPNLISLLLLSPVIIKLTRDYFNDPANR